MWSRGTDAFTRERYGKPLAYRCLRPLPSVLFPGWFTCYCGCGSVGVCRHCVPGAPLWVPWHLCEQSAQLVASGSYRYDAGRLEAVADRCGDEEVR